jgi:hypothetical protein
VEFGRRSEGGFWPASVSYPNFADLMDGLQSFSGLAGEESTLVSVAKFSGEARREPASFVMHNYFDVLRVQMAAGRAFRPEEDREPVGAPVTILSHRLSRTLFDEPSAAVGRSLLVNGLVFTVVGVVPEAFHGTEPGEICGLWLTGATWLYARRAPRETWDRGRANGDFHRFVGRLAPGASFEKAKAEIARATRALADAYPADNAKFRTAEAWMVRRPGLPLIVRPTVAFFLTLLGCVGVLLLILAAANVANLLLFRSARRRDETALRQALGATRWRLVRAHVMDSLLLALIGGAAGVLHARWSTYMMRDTAHPAAGPHRRGID